MSPSRTAPSVLTPVPPAVFSATLRARLARTAREQARIEDHMWTYDPHDGFPYPPVCGCH